MSGLKGAVKRGIDIVASTLGLAALSPVLILIAIAILAETGGPVLFVDPRIGRGGRLFSVYKFRTMLVGSPARFNDDGSMRVDPEDARVTRVGRLLRLGFDELPQLWNVLRGEMSLIGPRPDPPWAREKYRPGDEEKLQVRPGIAGLAQVMGRTSIPWRDRLELDRTYVRTFSLGLDARIAFLTMFELFPFLRRLAPAGARDAMVNIEKQVHTGDFTARAVVDPVMQPTSFLPFARPDLAEAEVAAVVECLRSGWLTTGPRTKEFEQKFAALVRPGGHALAVNSATAGLHLALEALGVAPGDEVIVPDYTFTASAEVVRYLGADPVLVDVDPHTLNVTADRLEAAVTSRTKVVMPVHFAGNGCDMEAILAMARRRGLAVVDDAAHALPATVGGRMIGSFETDATVFSFYANKTLCTGEGGMLVTRRRDVAERCAVMRLHGISRDAFARYVSTTPAWQYDVVAPGFKYNLTDIASALGIVQLERLHKMARRRAEIANAFLGGFADLPLRLPATPAPGDVHAWHLFVVRLTDDARLTRDAFIDQMYASGIGCSVHFIPLHRHPYWRDTYGLRAEQFPSSEGAYQGAVSLPIYSSMTLADVTRVIDTVRRLLRG